MSHDLLIAKLHSNRLVMPYSIFLPLYLTERRQRFKISNKYSSWSERLFKVPQGSIPDPLLFTIFLCDLSQFESNIEIADYTDDNTPHPTNEDLEIVLKDLEQEYDVL